MLSIYPWPCDPKSNAHAHMCAFALDGVKKRTDQPTDKQGVSSSRIYIYIIYIKPNFFPSALHLPHDPPFFVLLTFSTFSCIYVCYSGLCIVWVIVGLAKLNCGATPPSVMVLFKSVHRCLTNETRVFLLQQNLNISLLRPALSNNEI